MVRRIKSIIKSTLSPVTLYKLRYFKGYFLSIPYTGSKFQCPICRGTYRTFLSAGRKPRKNAACPRCGSLERQRAVWMYFKEKTELFSRKIKVLQFAPEFCLQRAFMSLPNIEYISADLYSRSAMVRINITDISFYDNTFDCILCSHVLEHIVKDRKAMKELFRVMKPNGFGIFNVPIKGETTFENHSIVSPELRLKYFGQEDHVRIYGKDFKDRLKDAGFKVNEDGNLNGINKEYYRLTPQGEDGENLYICFKP